MNEALAHPKDRDSQIGRADVERDIRAMMREGIFSHGWIIAGPAGAGKATLAYRIARAVLDPTSLTSDHDLGVSVDSQVFKLIAAEAHPDLFVATRLWNEKTSRFQSEITIETIRALLSFLNRTAAFGGPRVAIIDTADDLNRNAANALLKALEEPPKNTLLLLLSQSPGRLLPTIRSRCRRIDLRSVDTTLIAALLQQEGVAESDSAISIAANADGRPGYALRLAAGDGADAIKLADAFLARASSHGDIMDIRRALTGRNADEKWTIFRDLINTKLSAAAREQARGAASALDAHASNPEALLRAWESTVRLAARGEALNVDRGELIGAMAHDLRAALSA